MICWEKYSKINKKFDYLMELYSDSSLEEMRGKIWSQNKMINFLMNIHKREKMVVFIVN